MFPVLGLKYTQCKRKSSSKDHAARNLWYGGVGRDKCLQSSTPPTLCLIAGVGLTIVFFCEYVAIFRRMWAICKEFVVTFHGWSYLRSSNQRCRSNEAGNEEIKKKK